MAAHARAGADPGPEWCSATRVPVGRMRSLDLGGVEWLTERHVEQATFDEDLDALDPVDASVVVPRLRPVLPGLTVYARRGMPASPR